MRNRNRIEEIIAFMLILFLSIQSSCAQKLTDEFCSVSALPGNIQFTHKINDNSLRMINHLVVQESVIDLSVSQIANEEYITYVIRFRNTGNDTAFRVVLTDTLDNKLDWASLQPASASHPFAMTVTSGNIIHFTFSPVKLPPASMNEAKSHGYVAYKIKVKQNAVVGSTIKNRAHIYFDYNVPITTATVNTSIISLTTKNNHPGLKTDLLVFPNPNHGQFVVRQESNEQIQHIRLYDITGNLVFQQKKVPNGYLVDVSSMPAGLYALQIKTEKGMHAEKIIIE